MRLLLISNSGEPLYGWCKEEIGNFCGEDKGLVFISAATVYSPSEYFEKAQKSLKEVGIKLQHLDLDNNPQKSIENAKGFLVGGGLTLSLNKEKSIDASVTSEHLRKIFGAEEKIAKP